MKTDEPAPSLDVICALCGKKKGRHAAHLSMFYACPKDDLRVGNFHPTNRFTPAQPEKTCMVCSGRGMRHVTPEETVWCEHCKGTGKTIPAQPEAAVGASDLRLPWRAMSEPCENEREKGELHFAIFWNDSGCAAHVFRKEDATYIVHCVNTMPVVAEALELCIEAMIRYEMDVDGEATTDHRNLMRQARAALAAARYGNEEEHKQLSGVQKELERIVAMEVRLAVVEAKLDDVKRACEEAEKSDHIFGPARTQLFNRVLDIINRTES